MDEGFSLSRPYRVETRKRGGTLTVTLTLALSPRMRLHLEPANENKKLMEDPTKQHGLAPHTERPLVQTFGIRPGDPLSEKEVAQYSLSGLGSMELYFWRKTAEQCARLRAAKKGTAEAALHSPVAERTHERNG